MVVVSQHWKWPNCRADPHLQLSDVGRLPALCQEYKAWDSTCPWWVREFQSQAISLQTLAALTTH